MSVPPFRSEPFTDFGKPENQQAFQQALTDIQSMYINAIFRRARRLVQKSPQRRKPR